MKYAQFIAFFKITTDRILQFLSGGKGALGVEGNMWITLRVTHKISFDNSHHHFLNLVSHVFEPGQKVREHCIG
jgi:hypothetical protein